MARPGRPSRRDGWSDSPDRAPVSILRRRPDRRTTPPSRATAGRPGMVLDPPLVSEGCSSTSSISKSRADAATPASPVEGRTQTPHGQIELGGEQQHEEGRLECEPPAEQPQTDLHRHHRHAQGRHQLEDQGRQKGDAQHRHGRRSEGLAGPADRLDLAPRTTQHLEGRQPLDGVEEERAEPRHVEPLAPRPGVCEPADQVP